MIEGETMMADKDLGIRIFFSIPGVIFCLLSILFLSAEDLGNRIGGVIILLIGLLLLALCWLGLITRGKINVNTLFPWIFLMIGIIFFVSGIYSLASRIYVVTAGEHVTAGIAYVSYEIDGKEYLSSLNQGDSEYRKGQLIEVAYLAGNPETVYPCQFVVIGPCVITILGFAVIYLWTVKFFKRKRMR